MIVVVEKAKKSIQVKAKTTYKDELSTSAEHVDTLFCGKLKTK